jgi:hypothetical protein
MLYLRITAPTGVTRGSFLTLKNRGFPPLAAIRLSTPASNAQLGHRFYEPLLAPKHELTAASHIHHSWCSTLDRNWVEL